MTKTTNGNLAVSDLERSNVLAIWKIMAGTPEERIASVFINAFGAVLQMPESDKIVKFGCENDANDEKESKDEIKIPVCLAESKLTETQYKRDKLVRLLALVLRIVDHRNGGQGRRLESRAALLAALTTINDSKITRAMLTLYADHYGRYKNLEDIYSLLSSKTLSSLQQTYPEITQAFIDNTKSIIDEIWIEAIKSKNLHAAKWIPTENKDIDRAVTLARLLFPELKESKTCKGKPVTEKSSLNHKWHFLLSKFRTEVLKPLRSQIPMIERALCAGKADLIEPSKVPGVALLRSKRALENLASLRSKKGDMKRSDDPDRVQCALNFKKHAAEVLQAANKHREEMDALRLKKMEAKTEEEKHQIEKEIEEAEEKFEQEAPKVHGTSVFIHNLVQQLWKEGFKHNDIIEAQFENMKSSMKSLQKMKVLYVLDTSGSMTTEIHSGGNGYYTPIQVGTGLVALCASTAPVVWRHKFITFSRSPKVMNLSHLYDGKPRLIDYMTYIRQNEIIGNTNVQSTIDLIAGMSANLQDDDLLDIVIFLTDGQFDQMAIRQHNNVTAGDYFKIKFQEINKKAPLACFWNLNGTVTNSPAEPSEQGIVMMSGFNSSMLESFGETILAASQVSMEEILAQRKAAKLAFEESVRVRMEEEEKRMKEEELKRDLNTFQVALDFVDGKFSNGLREKLSKIDDGIFKGYEYKEIGENSTPQGKEEKKEKKENLIVPSRGGFRGRGRGGIRGGRGRGRGRRY
jgi:flagellar biosynthesis GTPase FlhF